MDLRQSVVALAKDFLKENEDKSRKALGYLLDDTGLANVLPPREMSPDRVADCLLGALTSVSQVEDLKEITSQFASPEELRENYSLRGLFEAIGNF